NDGQLDSVPATASITVLPVNDVPVANNQSLTSNEDTSLAIMLTGLDVEGSPLTYSIITGPAHGALSGTPPNISYLPATNYFGADSFTFKANDGQLDSAVATIAITVLPVNDAPIAQAQSVTLKQRSSTNIILTATDVENGALTFSILTSPAHGTLSGSASNVIYTAPSNYF